MNSERCTRTEAKVDELVDIVNWLVNAMEAGPGKLTMSKIREMQHRISALKNKERP